MERMWENALPA